MRTKANNGRYKKAKRIFGGDKYLQNNEREIDEVNVLR